MKPIFKEQTVHRKATSASQRRGSAWLKVKGARTRSAKELSEREHRCEATGFRATRDQAAALAMLVAGLKQAGREPSWAARPETPARAP